MVLVILMDDLCKELDQMSVPLLVLLDVLVEFDTIKPNIYYPPGLPARVEESEAGFYSILSRRLYSYLS